jgi:hypothetical protein
MPPPSHEVNDRESGELLADLDLFLNAECDETIARTAVGLEVAFGGRAPETVEPLARPDPIVVDLGRGRSLRIAGRIDRIDQLAGSTFEIVDYKTGGYWEQDWVGTFAGGRRLQHALYGLAATELLRRRHEKATVSGAQYYFSSAKGRQQRKCIPMPPLARTQAVLTDLHEVVAAGLFIHAHDDSACKWCDHGHACGDRAAKQAEEKIADPALEPYRRLMAHE